MTQKRQFILVIFFMALLTGNIFSQASDSKEKDDKEPSRVGYGVNLGNIRIYNRTFQFGLAPNVAYRITDPFSVGFMLKADYFYKKYQYSGAKFSAFDLGPTVFARLKPLWNWDNGTPFLKGLFLQAEYERAFLTRAYEYTSGDPVLDADGNVERAKIREDFVYVGIGASSGYPFSTNVSIHYNILDSATSQRFPFTYRIGFTYNY